MPGELRLRQHPIERSQARRGVLYSIEQYRGRREEGGQKHRSEVIAITWYGELRAELSHIVAKYINVAECLLALMMFHLSSP